MADYTINGLGEGGWGTHPRADPNLDGHVGYNEGGSSVDNTPHTDNDPDSLERALTALDSDDDDNDTDDAHDGWRDPLWRRRRQRLRGPRLTQSDERRVTVYLVVATVLFFAVSIGLGAANYYSPLACFSQRHNIEDVDRSHMRRDHSWIVLASAFFACGMTSLVALGLVVVGVVGCAALSLRVSRALACVF
ncbi:hypothetical protein psal_cds_316 [Pandoravirus salinus]|uniref:Transmembrane protein n=1 Tax=Pandoravirus salinus TaxID=1349410 RepID=S4VUA8_9VIRU|nr:hypothetical protein psal_cds_316 [Pandoravirus salinus]AGO83933.1 hypothetical protein psal_cds_316 [Pandoravirus salinus]